MLKHTTTKPLPSVPEAPLSPQDPTQLATQLQDTLASRPLLLQPPEPPPPPLADSLRLIDASLKDAAGRLTSDVDQARAALAPTIAEARRKLDSVQDWTAREGALLNELGLRNWFSRALRERVPERVLIRVDRLIKDTNALLSSTRMLADMPDRVAKLTKGQLQGHVPEALRFEVRCAVDGEGMAARLEEIRREIGGIARFMSTSPTAQLYRLPAIPPPTQTHAITDSAPNSVRR
jgi:hypothetical protein